MDGMGARSEYRNGVEKRTRFCIVDSDAHGAAIEAIAIFVGRTVEWNDAFVAHGGGRDFRSHASEVDPICRSLDCKILYALPLADVFLKSNVVDILRLVPFESYHRLYATVGGGPVGVFVAVDQI